MVARSAKRPHHGTRDGGPVLPLWIALAIAAGLGLASLIQVMEARLGRA